MLLALYSTCVNSAVNAQEVDARIDWADQQRYGFAVNGVIDSVKVMIGERLEKNALLAKLDTAPYRYRLSACRARVKQYEPAIVDAKLDLNHAQELFDRTVLSEVELQKINGKHKALKSEQDAQKAECQLMQWELDHAVLKAREDSYVVSSNLYPGMIISDENRADVFFEAVSATQALAKVWLSTEQLLALKTSDKLEVNYQQQEYPARIKSIGLQANKMALYEVKLAFYYRQAIEPGTTLKVSF